MLNAIMKTSFTIMLLACFALVYVSTLNSHIIHLTNGAAAHQNSSQTIQLLHSQTANKVAVIDDPSKLSDFIISKLKMYNTDMVFITTDPKLNNVDAVFDRVCFISDSYDESEYIKGFSVTGPYINQVGSKTGYKYEVKLEYEFSNEKMASMDLAVNKKVQTIVKSIITQNMTDYQKELAIHDYIVNNTVYDHKSLDTNNDDPMVHTAYDVLINHSGVCDGYAVAFKKLLDAVGIKNILVSGNIGEAHAWNIVMIDSKYYQVDVTFDDPIVDEGNTQILSHDYFNLTDNELSKDHNWNKALYPKCTSKTYRYKPNR